MRSTAVSGHVQPGRGVDGIDPSGKEWGGLSCSDRKGFIRYLSVEVARTTETTREGHVRQVTATVSE